MPITSSMTVASWPLPPGMFGTTKPVAIVPIEGWAKK
jgi:hypothetical protein